MSPAISSVLLKFQCHKDYGAEYIHMTPVAEVLKREHPDKKVYWQNELKSLGIEPRRQNELNDKEELQALAESIKAVYYQDYKTAYSSNDD